MPSHIYIYISILYLNLLSSIYLLFFYILYLLSSVSSCRSFPIKESCEIDTLLVLHITVLVHIVSVVIIVIIYVSIQVFNSIHYIHGLYYIYIYIYIYIYVYIIRSIKSHKTFMEYIQQLISGGNL